MHAIGGPDKLDDKLLIEAEIKKIISRERWPGFGVPFRATDERMDALKKHLSNTKPGGKPYGSCCC